MPTHTPIQISTFNIYRILNSKNMASLATELQAQYPEGRAMTFEELSKFAGGDAAIRVFDAMAKELAKAKANY
jgi:hypothetical protein